MQKRRSCFLPLTLALMLPVHPASALSVRQVYASDTKVGIQLKVWPGYDLAINFLPLKGVIKKARLGDPTHFVLSSDGNLCPQVSATESEKTCADSGANVIFLRQIQPIHFPGLMESKDGSTELTVIVTEADGQKVYQFRVIPAQGEPEYTSLEIEPDAAKPAPLFPAPVSRHSPVPLTVTNNSVGQQAAGSKISPSLSEDKSVNTAPLSSAPTHPVKTSAVPSSLPVMTNPIPVTITKPKTDAQKQSIAITTPLNHQFFHQSIDDANAAAFGLVTANQKGQIKPHTMVWNQAENAIVWLRRGNSQQAAAQKAGLELSVLHQLVVWGQNRP